MKCKNCNKDKLIVNKFFKLCEDCNNIRLYGSKFGKQYKNPVSKRSFGKTDKKHVKSKSKRSAFAPKIEKKKIDMVELDEIFYEECFDMSNHKCEECDCDLPTVFRDQDGKVVARWRYSHVIAKSIAPKLRHVHRNINHLCLKHHQQWEFGDKESMKIYKINMLRFPHYFR